ncbi:Oidioi.mRNA.OKI2018_I69.chr1.g1148.t1.cds [Oikopleura dioica]|uniref:Oidioi.mRNA.OKI2018_I69.chr1.g1148.t1.cds n=1 Tax=Oikopleura dioica TaxID=34765 RepID=A0ABN7SM13_OIKDI|nr:Oidioi.mRNA.OKI2018_I69.chr1.g1148.t1.cds [Oikopleura dioica]
MREKYKILFLFFIKSALSQEECSQSTLEKCDFEATADAFHSYELTKYKPTNLFDVDEKSNQAQERIVIKTQTSENSQCHVFESSGSLLLKNENTYCSTSKNDASLNDLKIVASIFEHEKFFNEENEAEEIDYLVEDYNGKCATKFSKDGNGFSWRKNLAHCSGKSKNVATKIIAQAVPLVNSTLTCINYDSKFKCLESHITKSAEIHTKIELEPFFSFPSKFDFDLSNFKKDTLELAKVKQSSSEFDLPIGEAFEKLCSLGPKPGVTHELSKYFRRARADQLVDLFDELSYKCSFNEKEWRKLFRTVITWCDSFDCLEAAEETKILSDDEISKMILTRTEFSKPLLEKIMNLENNNPLKFAAFINFLPQMSSKMALEKQKMIEFINFFTENKEENCDLATKRILSEKGLIDQNSIFKCFHQNEELDRVLISGANDGQCEDLSGFYEDLIFFGHDSTEIRARAFLKWMVCPTSEKMAKLERNFEFLSSVQLQAFIKSYMHSIQFSSDPTRWYLKPFIFNLDLPFDPSSLQSSFINLHVPTDFHSATVEGFTIFADDSESMLPELLYSNASLTFYGETFDLASLEIRKINEDNSKIGIGAEIGVFGRKMVSTQFDSGDLERMKELFEWNWWTGDYSNLLPELKTGEIDLNFNEILLMTDFSIPSIYGDYMDFSGCLIGANQFEFDWAFSSIRGVNLLLSSDINLEFNVDVSLNRARFEESYQISVMEETKVKTELNFALDSFGNVEMFGKISPPKFQLGVSEKPKAILSDNWTISAPEVFPDLVFKMKKLDDSWHVTVEDFIEGRIKFLSEPFFVDLNLDGKFGDEFLHLYTLISAEEKKVQFQLKTDLPSELLDVSFASGNQIWTVSGEKEYLNFGGGWAAFAKYGSTFDLANTIFIRLSQNDESSKFEAKFLLQENVSKALQIDESFGFFHNSTGTSLSLKTSLLDQQAGVKIDHDFDEKNTYSIGIRGNFGDNLISQSAEINLNDSKTLSTDASFAKKDHDIVILGYEARFFISVQEKDRILAFEVEFNEVQDSQPTENGFFIGGKSQFLINGAQESKEFTLKNEISTKNIFAKQAQVTDKIQQTVDLNIDASVIQRPELLELKVKSTDEEYLLLSYLLRNSPDDGDDHFSTILRANLYIPYLIKLENGYLFIDTYKLLSADHKIRVNAKISSVLLTSDPAEYDSLPRSNYAVAFEQDDFKKIKGDFEDGEEKYTIAYSVDYKFDEESIFSNISASAKIDLGGVNNEFMLDIFNNENDARIDGVYIADNNSITFQSAFDKKGIASTGVLSKIKELNSPSAKIRKIGGWQWKFKPESSIGSLQLFHPIEDPGDLTRIGDVAAYRMTVNFRKYRRFGKVFISGKSKYPGKYKRADFVGNLDTLAKSMNFTLTTDEDVKTKIDFAINDAIELHLVDNVFLSKYLQIDLYFISRFFEKKRWRLRSRIGHALAPVFDCSSTGDITDTTILFKSSCSGEYYDKIGFELQSINSAKQISSTIFGFNRDLVLDVDILDEIKKNLLIIYHENETEMIKWRSQGALDLKNQPRVIISTSWKNEKFPELAENAEFESGFRVNELQTSINKIDVKSILASLKNFDIEHWTMVSWNQEKIHFRPKLAVHLNDDSLSVQGLYHFENSLKNINQDNGIEFIGSRSGDSAVDFVEKLAQVLASENLSDLRSRRSLMFGETNGLAKLSVKIDSVNHYLEISGNGRILRSGQVDMTSLFSTSLGFLEEFFGPYIKLNIKGSRPSRILQIALDNRTKRQELELALETSSRDSGKEKKIRLRNVKFAQSFDILSSWPREISMKGICQSTTSSQEKSLVELLLDDFSVRCDRLDLKIRKDAKDILVGLDGSLQRVNKEFQGSVEIRTKELEEIPRRMKVLITGNDISEENFQKADFYCGVDPSNSTQLASRNLSTEISRHLSKRVECFFVAKFDLQFLKSDKDFGEYDNLGSGETVMSVANLGQEKYLFQANFDPDEVTSELLTISNFVGSFLVGENLESVARIQYQPMSDKNDWVAYLVRHDFYPLESERPLDSHDYRSILIKKQDSNGLLESFFKYYTAHNKLKRFHESLENLQVFFPFVNEPIRLELSNNFEKTELLTEIEGYKVTFLGSYAELRFGLQKNNLEESHIISIIMDFNDKNDDETYALFDYRIFDRVYFGVNLTDIIGVGEQSGYFDGRADAFVLQFITSQKEDQPKTILTMSVGKQEEQMIHGFFNIHHKDTTCRLQTNYSTEEESFELSFNLIESLKHHLNLVLATNWEGDKMYDLFIHPSIYLAGEDFLSTAIFVDLHEEMKNIHGNFSIYPESDQSSFVNFNLANNFDSEFDAGEEFRFKSSLLPLPDVTVSDQLEFDLKGLGGVYKVSTECGLNDNNNEVVTTLLRCPRFFSRIGRVNFETEDGPGSVSWNADRKLGKIIVPTEDSQKIYDLNFGNNSVFYQHDGEFLSARWNDQEISIQNELEDSWSPVDFDELKISSTEDGIQVNLDSEKMDVDVVIDGDGENYSIRVEKDGEVSTIEKSEEKPFKISYGENMNLEIETDASGSEFSWKSETSEGSLYFGLGGVELNSRDEQGSTLSTGLRCEINPLNPKCKAWLNDKFVKIYSKLDYEVDYSQRIKILARIYFEQNIFEEIPEYLAVNSIGAVGIGDKQYFSSGFGYTTEKKEKASLSSFFTTSTEEDDYVVEVMAANFTETGSIEIRVSDFYVDVFFFSLTPDDYSFSTMFNFNKKYFDDLDHFTIGFNGQLNKKNPRHSGSFQYGDLRFDLNVARNVDNSDNRVPFKLAFEAADTITQVDTVEYSSSEASLVFSTDFRGSLNFEFDESMITAGNITLCSQTFDAIGAENCIDHLTIDLPSLVYETNLQSFKDILTYKMHFNNSLVEFDVGIPCFESVLDSKMELENGGIQDFEDATNTKNNIDVFEGLWIRCFKTFRSENYQCSTIDSPVQEKQRFFYLITVLLTFLYNYLHNGLTNKIPIFWLLGGSGILSMCICIYECVNILNEKEINWFVSMGSGSSVCKPKKSYEVEESGAEKKIEEKANAPPPTETLIQDRIISGVVLVESYGCETQFLPEICRTCISKFWQLSSLHNEYLSNNYHKSRDSVSKLQPQVDLVGEISALVRQSKNDLEKNFISAIEGFSGAFGWFQGNPDPRAAKNFVMESKNSGLYFWNRIRINELEESQKGEVKKIKEEIDKIFRQLMAYASSENLPSQAEQGATNSSPPKKEPVKKLEGKKWIIENAEGTWDLKVEMDQRVHIISSTGGGSIKGKCNSISVDNCKNFNFEFDSVISQVEIINCSKVGGQVKEVCPCLSIDSSNDVRFFISDKSKNVEVVVSRAKDSMLLIEEADDFNEYPIPEQFKIKYENRKLDVKHVDHL